MPIPSALQIMVVLTSKGCFKSISFSPSSLSPSYVNHILFFRNYSISFLIISQCPFLPLLAFKICHVVLSGFVDGLIMRYYRKKKEMFGLKIAWLVGSLVETGSSEEDKYGEAKSQDNFEKEE